MLSIPSEVETLIESGRFSLRWMIRFDLDSGSTGIWNDTYQITFEDVIYGPLAGNMTFDAIPGSSNLNADRLTVVVSNLSTAVVTIIAAEDWHQRPCVLMLAILNDAGIVQHVIPRFAGFLDEIEISDAADDLAKVTLAIESNFRELNRINGRTRSDSDQRRILLTDGFFKHAAAANADTNIYWGRKGPQKPPKKSFLQKIFPF